MELRKKDDPLSQPLYLQTDLRRNVILGIALFDE